MAKRLTQREREFRAASKIASALRGLRKKTFPGWQENAATKRALRWGISMALGCDTTNDENRQIGELLKVQE